MSSSKPGLRPQGLSSSDLAAMSTSDLIAQLLPSLSLNDLAAMFLVFLVGTLLLVITYTVVRIVYLFVCAVVRSMYSFVCAVVGTVYSWWQWWWQGDVVIFWDYENCGVPKGEKPIDVVGRVYKTAKLYGTVKGFRAYIGYNPDLAAIALRDAIRKYKGNLISCPRHGKMEVVDRNMIVDIFTYAFDTHDKAHKTTFILITGDGDFMETVMHLQERQYTFVIISPDKQGSNKLRNLGAEVKDWKTVSMTEA